MHPSAPGARSPVAVSSPVAAQGCFTTAQHASRGWSAGGYGGVRRRRWPRASARRSKASGGCGHPWRPSAPRAACILVGCPWAAWGGCSHCGRADCGGERVGAHAPSTSPVGEGALSIILHAAAGRGGRQRSAHPRGTVAPCLWPWSSPVRRVAWKTRGAPSPSVGIACPRMRRGPWPDGCAPPGPSAATSHVRGGAGCPVRALSARATAGRTVPPCRRRLARGGRQDARRARRPSARSRRADGLREVPETPPSRGHALHPVAGVLPSSRALRPCTSGRTLPGPPCRWRARRRGRMTVAHGVWRREGGVPCASPGGARRCPGGCEGLRRSWTVRCPRPRAWATRPAGAFVDPTAPPRRA